MSNTEKKITWSEWISNEGYLHSKMPDCLSKDMVVEIKNYRGETALIKAGFVDTWYSSPVYAESSSWMIKEYRYELKETEEDYGWGDWTR